MPRLVVPIRRPELALSRTMSSSRWSERISGALSAIRRISGVIDDALRGELFDLLDEVMRIDDDAVADHRELAAHHARGDQRELVARPSMTSVWPALWPPW